MAYSDHWIDARAIPDDENERDFLALKTLPGIITRKEIAVAASKMPLTQAQIDTHHDAWQFDTFVRKGSRCSLFTGSSYELWPSIAEVAASSKDTIIKHFLTSFSKWAETEAPRPQQVEIFPGIKHTYAYFQDANVPKSQWVDFCLKLRKQEERSTLVELAKKSGAETIKVITQLQRARAVDPAVLPDARGWNL